MAKKKGKIKPQKGKSGKRFKLSDKKEENSQQFPPIFSLEYLQSNSGYCISDCTKDEKSLFAETLKKLGQTPWSQIFASGKHGIGFEKISTDALKVGVPSAVDFPDVKFIAFRFGQKRAMVGFRNNRVFHILWLDRDFSLYNH